MFQEIIETYYPKPINFSHYHYYNIIYIIPKYSSYKNKIYNVTTLKQMCPLPLMPKPREIGYCCISSLKSKALIVVVN